MWQAVDLKKLVRLRKKIPHYATLPYSVGLWDCLFETSQRSRLYHSPAFTQRTLMASAGRYDFV